MFREGCVQARNGDVEQACEILRYFIEHPQASDDLEGIARWRLMQRTVARRVDEVSRALELLVSLRLLRRDRSPAYGTRYSLNLARIKESEAFAAGNSKSGQDS